ncbi:MAG: hypothetical protein SX243_19895, partial [Acidobacteriota bacterium]|nr:hypothetical protein [Acidobacteriota bacterium]
MKHLTTGLALATIILLCPGILDAAPLQDAQIVEVAHDPGALIFAPIFGHGGMQLTVTGPSEFVHSQDFVAGEGGILDARSLADGVYSWEIVARPDLSQELAERIARARQNGDLALIEDLKKRGVLPESPLMQNGTFTVVHGQVVDPSLTEAAGDGAQAATDGSRSPATGSGGITNATDEFYASGDLYVHNSACIGFDCPTTGLS